jgi:virulence-associated protein VapD
MQAIWFRNSKDKEIRKAEVLGYRNAFDDLKEILEQHYMKRDAVREYSHGWEYKQVAVNEYNAVLDDILNLIDLNHKD